MIAQDDQRMEPTPLQQGGEQQAQIQTVCSPLLQDLFVRAELQAIGREIRRNGYILEIPAL